MKSWTVSAATSRGLEGVKTFASYNEACQYARTLPLNVVGDIVTVNISGNR